MKRLLTLVALGALVVGATGCNVSPSAATVNGVAISQSTLNGVLATEIANGGAQCAAQYQSGQTGSPLGEGSQSDGTTPNAVTPAFADNALETLILQELEVQTLARHRITVTGADVTAATTDYENQLEEQESEAATDSTTPPGCALSTTLPLAGQLPRAFLRREAVSLADQEMFEVAVAHVDLGTAALESYYHAHRTEVTKECLNVIVADTEAAAQTLHNEIAAGASFATAATAAGSDTSITPPGGTLACEYPAQADQQFGTTLAATIDALSTGQLAPPLTWQTETSTGGTATYYLVLQMRQHQLVPFATLAASIRQAILEQHSAAVGETLNKMVGTAHVTVDPRYGTWSPKHGVTVPTPPPPAFVLNAKANVATPTATSLPLTAKPASG